MSPRLHATVPLLVAATLCVALFACPTTTSSNAASCPNLCTNQLPCAQTLQQCLDSCSAQEQTCNASGHPSTFQAYVGCAVTAGFSCTDAGQPMVNAPCGPQATDLQECQVEVDGGFDIPDGAIAKDTACVNATGGCFTCCAQNHPAGASAFTAATKACTCGPDGVCEAEGGACVKEACATPAVMPQPNDPCDRCLTNALDDQATPAGPCVGPVTVQCNKTLDCALYVNCATQTGCSN